MGQKKMKIKLSEKQDELFFKMQNIFSQPVYAVGGCVRDIMLGNEPNDYDFCTPLLPEQIKEELKGKYKTYLIGEKFGTIGFTLDGEKIEITTFRSETYKHADRKPDVVYVKDITADLSRRDFTINAMAIRCGSSKLIDPYNGKEDCDNGIIKCVGNSKERFNEDALRILRGVRFAARFGFTIEEKTGSRMVKMNWKLTERKTNGNYKVSAERWREELNKMIMSPRAHRAWLILMKYNIFQYIIPELHLQKGYEQNSKYHSHTLDMHTYYVLKGTVKDNLTLEMRWSAILHDISKPFVRTERVIVLEDGDLELRVNYINHEVLGGEMTRATLEKLKFPNKFISEVTEIVATHLKDENPLRPYDNANKII